MLQIDAPPPTAFGTAVYDTDGHLCGAAIFRADGQLDRAATLEAGGRYWLTTSGCLIDLAAKPPAVIADVVEYEIRRAA